MAAWAKNPWMILQGPSFLKPSMFLDRKAGSKTHTFSPLQTDSREGADMNNRKDIKDMAAAVTAHYCPAGIDCEG